MVTSCRASESTSKSRRQTATETEGSPCPWRGHSALCLIPALYLGTFRQVTFFGRHFSASGSQFNLPAQRSPTARRCVSQSQTLKDSGPALKSSASIFLVLSPTRPINPLAPLASHSTPRQKSRAEGRGEKICVRAFPPQAASKQSDSSTSSPLPQFSLPRWPLTALLPLNLETSFYSSDKSAKPRFGPCLALDKARLSCPVRSTHRTTSDPI